LVVLICCADDCSFEQYRLVQEQYYGLRCNPKTVNIERDARQEGIDTLVFRSS